MQYLQNFPIFKCYFFIQNIDQHYLFKNIHLANTRNIIIMVDIMASGYIVLLYITL